jgi:hypothetical protein
MSAFTALAQDAQLSGFIEDPTGGKVATATITVLKTETQTKRVTTSNSSGFYDISDLSPGHYQVRVDADGFRKLVQDGVELAVAQSARLDFHLDLASTADAITVVGDASQVNTTDGSVGMLVSHDLVENLPLNGRTLQQLITLTPGASLSVGNLATGQFVVNGQRADSNYLTVDGVSAISTVKNGSYTGGNSTSYNAVGGTNGIVSVDALQEFRILTSSYAPEYGRTVGGQILLQTRSGTNTFHGGLYEYLRNDQLDANNWFANSTAQPRSPERFNNFGGTIGGPIVANKTFFFFSYEAQRLVEPQFQIWTVPSLASRQSASPATQPLLDAYPIPNGPVLASVQAQFASGYSSRFNTDALDFRADHNIGTKFRVFGTFNYSPSSANNRSAAGAEAASQITLQSLQTKSLTLGSTYIITPRVVNEFRINLSDNTFVQNFVLDNFGGAVPPPESSWFIPGFTPSNSYAALSLGYAGSSLFQGKSINNKQRQINIVDSTGMTRDAHQIKVGIDYRLLLPVVGAVHGFIYSPSSISALSANSISQFINTFTEAVPGDVANVSAYAQDTWRASSRLTLTYGVRWESNTPPRNRDPNNGNYVPLLGNYATGAIQVGAAGTPLWNSSYLNFAPRLGVAYRLRQRPGWETVIRAGTGLFYDLGNIVAASQAYNGSFPGNLQVSLAAASLPIGPVKAQLPVPNLNSPAPASAFNVFPRDFSLPRTTEWNVTVEQALGASQALTVSYVGAAGRDLLYTAYYLNVTSQNYTVINNQNAGSSDYEALQIQFQRRLSRGLSSIVGYTWGHSIDTNSIDVGIRLPATENLSASSNRGSSDFDLRHVLHASASYSIPGVNGKSWLGAITRNFGLDGILTAQTAFPFDVTQTRNIGFGSFALRPDVVPNLPLWINDPNVAGGRRLNPTAFVVPANRQGDLGRNTLRAFDLIQLDLSARRSFRLTERFGLLLRADMFNLLNHPNFASPTSTIGSGLFGQSTALANTQLGYGLSGLNPLFQLGGPRSIQLSLRLQF